VENKLATYIVEYQKYENPILEDNMVDILTEAFYADPYNFGIPIHFEDSLECAIQVVVPSDNAGEHLEAFGKYMFKKSGLIYCEYHQTTDSYKDDSEIKYFMGELCKPFSLDQVEEPKIINSLEKGLELIKIKLEVLEEGRIDMSVSEAINFAFCFPKYGKMKTILMCNQLFKNIDANINESALEAFIDVLFNHSELHSDLDLTLEFRDNILRF
jgi:hypothetical protein